MNLEILFVIAILTLILGSVLTYKFGAGFFVQFSINKNNAFKALQAGSVEDWNSLRILDKSWRPRLVALDFSELNLQGLNVEDSTIEGCNFRNTLLDQADFSNSVVTDVDFSQASLRGALFTGATLKGNNFSGADLTDTLFDTPVDNGENIAPVSGIEESVFSKSLRGEEFEALVENLLRGMGYKVGSSKGGGHKADFFAIKDTGLGRETVVVEVKHFRTTGAVLPTSAVRALFGRKELTGASKGFFFTNGTFSDSAHRLARDLEGIELFDQYRIVDLLPKSFD